MHIYSDVNLIVFSDAYFHVSIFLIAAVDCFLCSEVGDTTHEQFV